MPSSQHRINLSFEIDLNELSASSLTPAEILRVFSESVPDLSVNEVLNILVPNKGMRAKRSVIEGLLAQLAGHPAVMNESDELVLHGNPGEVEALYFAISAILRAYPDLKMRTGRLELLRHSLHRKLYMFGFMESDVVPNIDVPVVLEDELEA